MAFTSGPEDQSLWITRKLGYLENNFLETDERISDNVVTNTCLFADNIDIAKMEKAYRALIYNQPTFRATVRRDDPQTAFYVPASDFSDVFEFIDESQDSNKDVGFTGAWQLAEKLAHQYFAWNSESPLNKCYLVKRPDCYILLIKMHHVIGDGTTSLRVINEVLTQYDRLVSGKDIQLNPAPVVSSVEDMCSNVTNEQVLDHLVSERKQRLRTQKMLLPLPMEELQSPDPRTTRGNRTLPAIGSKKGFDQMKKLTKELGITIGSYSFSVMFYAIAAVSIRRKGGKFPHDGLPLQYTDVIVNMRNRVEPSPGECFMMCISDITVHEKIEASSTLYGTAKKISKQLKTALAEKHPTMYSKVKQVVELGNEGDEFNSYIPAIESSCSNQMIFHYQTEYTWGTVQSIHCLGSYWCPYYNTMTLLFQTVNGAINYTMVCCDRDEAKKDAQEVLDLFVQIMENTDDLVNESTGVMDFVNCNSFH